MDGIKCLSDTFWQQKKNALLFGKDTDWLHSETSICQKQSSILCIFYSNSFKNIFLLELFYLMIAHTNPFFNVAFTYMASRSYNFRKP